MASRSIRTRIIRITILPVIVTLILLMVLKGIEALDDTKQQLRLYAEQALSQLVTASEVYLSLGNQDGLQRHIERLAQHQEIEAISVSNYESNKTFTAGTKRNARDTTHYARWLQGLIPNEFIVWEQPIRQQAINPFDHILDDQMKTIGNVELILDPYRITDRNVHRVFFHFLISSAGVVMIVLLTVLLARRLARPLTNLAERSDTIRRRVQGGESGNLEYPQTRLSKNTNEIAVLENGFNHMVSALETAKRDLEQRVQRATAQIQTLLEETSRIAEREKRALANELHDELGQILVKLKWQAISIRDADEGEASYRVLCERGGELEAGIDRVYALVNDIINRLHPEELETLGLQVALQKNIDEWTLTNRNCEYSLSLKYDDIDNLDSEVSLIVYRIVQESLTNATKHANANKVVVTISGDPKSGTLQLQIVDDGIGFIAERIGPGCHGIRTMRERTAAFGGIFVVSSQPGQGTTIDVSIPSIEANKPRENLVKTCAQKGEKRAR